MTSRAEAARLAATASLARAAEKLSKKEEADRRRKRRRLFLAAAGLAGVGITGLATWRLWQSGVVQPQPDPLVPGSYGFRYTAGEQQRNAWYRDRVGEPVHVQDFPIGEGAIAIWEGVPILKPVSILYLDPMTQHIVPSEGGGTAKETGFDAPPGTLTVPHGDGIFVAFYAGCTHACCILGFHESYQGLDIYHCTCHNARYDPWRLVEYEIPHMGTYIGAKHLQLPADRPLPYVPLELVGDRLHGVLSTENRNWFRYCGLKKE